MLLFTPRSRRKEYAKRYYLENRGVIAERAAWYRYTHREEIAAKAEYRKRYGKNGKPYPRIRAKKMKEAYKIQLHPEAKPFTILGSREDVEKVVALYRRLTKERLSAYPFFYFPLTVEKWSTARYPFPPIVISGENKEAYRGTLSLALENLRRAEARRKGVELEGDALREALEAAKAEALDILTLIAEYRRLPDVAPNKARTTEEE